MNSKKKINKILKIIKLDKLKHYIINANNKKLIAFFYKNKKILFILKISFNQFTTNQFTNESKSYFFLKNKNINFNLTTFKNVYKKKKISISKIKYIKGKQGNFFDLENFFIKDKFKFKSIKFDNYFKILIKNFKVIHSYDLKRDKEFKKINSYFKKERLNIAYSHGDFVHWNSIKTNNKYFLYDLEYFSKKRIFLYDIFHWLIAPITNKLRFFKYKINYNYLLILFLKFYLNKFKFKLDNRQIIKYLLLYFLEQKYIYLLAKDINKKYNIISAKNLKNSKLLTIFYSNQIKLFLKYLK